ncbi:AraC family transcriptional regulator [Convivina intestini]|uniref:AraC family transcriptional regulator n=1 Tax=Convivina intestini TaxID=1505726 RepID=UPI0020109C67|nr:AraC family transcriptional regulator [Convivina intestini]CAH1851769.1 hypothetical protein R078131_00337 [Convivina intestini]
MTSQQNHLIKTALKINKTALFNSSAAVQPIDIKLSQGLDLIYHDYAFKNYNNAINFSKNILRIDFSFKGSISFIKNNQKHIFLEPGFLKISKSSTDHNIYSTDNGHYQGVTIIIDQDKISSNFQYLIAKNNLLKNLVDDYDLDNGHAILKSEYIDQMFHDIKSVEVPNQLQYYCLKIAELLLYLDSKTAHSASLSPEYFFIENTQKIYAIHQYLRNNLNKKNHFKIIS